MMGYVSDQLRKEGVPEGNIRAAAAHLTGQAVMESNINPGSPHDAGTGFGIYGARLGRRSAMFKWMGEHGYGKTSLEGQSRYMAHEAMSGRYPRTRNILMHANPGTFSRDVPTITREFEAPKYVNPRTGAVENAYRNAGTIADRERAPGTAAREDIRSRDRNATQRNDGGQEVVKTPSAARARQAGNLFHDKSRQHSQHRVPRPAIHHAAPRPRVFPKPAPRRERPNSSTQGNVRKSAPSVPRREIPYQP